MIRYLALLITLCWPLLWPLEALAYLPTVNELLTDITAQRVNVGAIEAVYAPDNTGPSASFQEMVSFRAPDRIRVNLVQPEREQTFLAVGTRVMALGQDQEPEIWPQPFLLFRLLVDADVVRLRQLLAVFGVDLKKVSLGRQNNRIVYILGARAGDTTRPQAWFERDTLNLSRLILPAVADKPGYDVALSGFRRHEKRLDWPDLIVTRVGDRPARTLRLVSLTLQPLADHPPAQKDLQTENQPDARQRLENDPDVARMRRQMEWFRKKLE